MNGILTLNNRKAPQTKPAINEERNSIGTHSSIAWVKVVTTSKLSLFSSAIEAGSNKTPLKDRFI